jgi:hypothetical protein
LQGSVETQPAGGGKMGDEVRALKEQEILFFFFFALNKFEIIRPNERFFFNARFLLGAAALITCPRSW